MNIDICEYCGREFDLDTSKGAAAGFCGNKQCKEDAQRSDGRFLGMQKDEPESRCSGSGLPAVLESKYVHGYGRVKRTRDRMRKALYNASLKDDLPAARKHVATLRESLLSLDFERCRHTSVMLWANEVADYVSNRLYDEDITAPEWWNDIRKELLQIKASMR